MAMTLIALALLVSAPDERPDGSLDALAACLDVAAADARAACLERTARVLVAESRRERPTETAKQRFGMPAARRPDVPRARVASPPRVDRLEGVVAQVAQAPLGLWAFSLADGSRWLTQEGGLSAPPRVGQTLVIKRAALGSYRVIFARERPVQVKRVG